MRSVNREAKPWGGPALSEAVGGLEVVGPVAGRPLRGWTPGALRTPASARSATRLTRRCSGRRGTNGAKQTASTCRQCDRQGGLQRELTQAARSAFAAMRSSSAQGPQSLNRNTRPALATTSRPGRTNGKGIVSARSRQARTGVKRAQGSSALRGLPFVESINKQARGLGDVVGHLLRQVAVLDGEIVMHSGHLPNLASVPPVAKAPR